MELFDWEMEDIEAQFHRIGKNQLNGKTDDATGVPDALFETEDNIVDAEMKNELTNCFGADPYELYRDEIDIETAKKILYNVFLTPDGKVEG